jgi:lipopolysaccharide transport system permease protein
MALTKRGEIAPGDEGVARQVAVPERDNQAVVRIEPTRRWLSLKLREVWSYRELLYFFIWRDIKVRYKQTVLGAAWAIIQPFTTMVVFSVFFGTLARISPGSNIPYPIFSYAGLLPWMMFTAGVTSASTSLVGASQLIRRVYFPRLIIPLEAVLTPVVDFCIAFVVFVAMAYYYNGKPIVKHGQVVGHYATALGPRALLLLPFLLLALLTAFAVGSWFAALAVKYRDVTYVMSFVVTVWLFATPVVYPSTLLNRLGGPWKTLLGLNPMSGVVEGFRWALLPYPRPGPMALLSMVAALATLVAGSIYFGRTERTFADVV